MQAAVIAGILVGLLGLVACAGQPATQTARPTSTPELLTEEPSTATALLAPTPTPEPLPTGTTARAPDHVRLDLDDGIVVAFADDSSRGRIAYVTHVPSGAQAVLDAEGAVIERHGSPGGDGGLLDVVLEDVNAMARIQEGLRYKGSLLRNPIADWLDVIRFSGIEYHRSSHPHSGASDGEQQLDQSHLGTVLYRVAFSLDANLVPVGYRPQDGDAAYLGPGTAIHRVKVYDPSQRLAAVVDGEVLLYDRSGPTSLNGAATHPDNLLPWCNDLEPAAWRGGVPTPAPSGPPTHGTDDQPGNVLCRAAPTVTDTPRPGRSTGAAPGQGEPDNSIDLGASRPSERPVLDEDYDDSWVANVPEVIGGYRVLYIITPKSVACSPEPVILLQAPQESMDEFLSAPLDVNSLRAAIRSIPGAPSHFNLSFGGPIDREAFETRIKERNELMASRECISFVDPDGPAIPDPEPPDDSENTGDAGGPQQSDREVMDSQDRPVIDVDYDDSWVQYVPEVIGGHQVLYIDTPKSRACSSLPVITLLTPKDSVAQFLGASPDVDSLIRSVPGLPPDISLSFTNNSLDTEAKAGNDEQWNARMIRNGCLQWMHPDGGIHD